LAVRLRRGDAGAITGLLLFAIVVCTGLSACVPSGSAHGKTLRIPLYGFAGNPDPARVSTPSGVWLSSLLFSGLVKFGPDLHVIPELAVSIPTISGDGRDYTFTLRQDARFADGRRCTSADVAYSLYRALLPATRSPWAWSYLGNIEGAGAVAAGRASRLSGVQVIDQLTLTIHLVRPDADFLQKMAFPVASIVDRRAIGRYRSNGWIDHPAGTGPWMVTARERNGSLELAPRRHFYGGPLDLGSLLLVPVANQVRALDLYRKGGLDVAEVPAQQYASMAGRSDFQESSGLDAYYALPASGRAPALAAVLDRDKLVQQSTPMLSPLSSIVPPAVPDYVAAPPSVDPVLSADGAPVVPKADIQLDRPGDWVLSMLREALYRQWPAGHGRGISIRLVHVRLTLPDPGVWLRLVLPQTKSRWYRAILARSASLTLDPVSRMNAYSQEENWALQQGYVIPLAGGNIAYLIKSAVQNLQVAPLGLMPENNNWALVDIR
jgi:ABC-type transport system substrate-binding protein